jgi:hypothetical protein
VIIVKTTLRGIPKTCRKCPFYTPKYRGIESYDGRMFAACKGMTAWLPAGRAMEIHPSKERADFCPLREVEG